MMREQRTKKTSLDEGLKTFEEALPSADRGVRDLLVNIRDAVLRTKAELEQIHVSSLPHPTGLRLICFDCGDTNLDVVYTSKRDCCQLCASCFRKRENRGAARSEHETLRSTSLSHHFK